MERFSERKRRDDAKPAKLPKTNVSRGSELKRRKKKDLSLVCNLVVFPRLLTAPLWCIAVALTLTRGAREGRALKVLAMREKTKAALLDDSALRSNKKERRCLFLSL